MSKYPSDTFCAFPFIHLVTHNSGTYGPCCSASEYFYVNADGESKWTRQYEGDFLNEKVIPYGLGIEEAFHSKPMQELRTKLLNGEKPSTCDWCWLQEKHILSKRQFGNIFYFSEEDVFKGIMDLSPEDISSNPQLRSIDLKFSNKCNLHCLMCNSGSSDMWQALDHKIHDYLVKHNLKTDWIFLADQKQSASTALIDKSEDWDLERHETSIFHGTDHLVHSRHLSADSFPQELYEEVKSLIPQLREIQCTGGEPFVSSQFVDLLKHAIETGHAEHIALEITTNGTKFVTDIMDLLQHFRHVRFLISIDGTEGTYEYIRAPFRYSKLLERLHTLKDYTSSGKIKCFTQIPVVVMSYNLFDYDNLNSKIVPIVGTNNIHLTFELYNADSPLHPKWLPDELLNDALNFYQDKINSATTEIQKSNNEYILSRLKDYIADNPVDAETKLYNQRRFKNYTVLMDKVLNRDYHNFLDPRLIKFLDSIEGDI
jgi:MoaA/NifB/PqqE/SkfB family radical SAM enzyme